MNDILCGLALGLTIGLVIGEILGEHTMALNAVAHNAAKYVPDAKGSEVIFMWNK